MYPIGTHLVTPRTGYDHHGIYVGNGKVVHYAGFARGFNTGPVEEVTLETFTDGGRCRVKSHANQKFYGVEVAERARAKIGEDSYNLAFNNCEHLCEWCVNGRHHSEQVFNAATGFLVTMTMAVLGVGYGISKGRMRV
ncbi:lecithin retinol acyltransferase family protein [Aeromonas caviae]|uniref:lecithin retinol acyltransferase family protein n=1 Tax=Aeromonas TaxID=642 RepID=UPI000CDBBA27|nr:MULTISPECIES: lecithin retinol acyltransferase family protein [Aeromonas]AUZ80801.1 hypothetical protein C2U37_14930 [Aeromonas sp. ASNIH1]MDX7689896.1 lecithin retinol acyltransferase family protein [Aeromonas caviae]MDX7770134.1 lecithin retinol acyltransferase family protein [Aeromonas caviae]MDX7846874.1 lecithin retinol acyltransferase family protein [Aeromonas caviae]